MRAIAILILLASTVATAERVRADSLIEPPFLKARVVSKALPPIGERLPEDVQVVDMAAEGKVPGRHGGELKLLLGKQKDTRMITVYGYARLVGYTPPDFELKPDLLKAVDVEEGRIFTLHLRKGHKWSDGHPFTAEDFRYYWEDIANNRALSRGGPPKQLRVAGEIARFEVIDPHTVRYSWSSPNPTFLPWLAGARPPSIYRPAHYLKQFHEKYGDREEIEKLVKAEGRRNWAELHFSRDRPYRADNPDRPTLDPWVCMTHPPSQRFVYVRNPYYHRIDKQGRQLPYLDSAVLTLGSVDMVPARTGSGEANLQARYLRFEHYTFLKKAEKRNKMQVRLWKTLKSAHKAIYPNLNAEDPVWRKLLRDARFRRALSMGIHRHEINQVIYYGLANESNNTVFPESKLYRPEYQHKWAQFDLKRANALLDEIGLTARDDEGIRLLPDGRPLHIIIDLAGESTEESDILELVGDSWRQLGIKLFPRPSQREVFRNRVFSGKAIMSIWAGFGNGLSTAEMSPEHFTPSVQYQYQWPKWGLYVSRDGKKGEKPDLPEAQRLVALQKQWRLSTDRGEKERIWHEILRINADQVFTIGIVNGTLQPVVVANSLQNVPLKGVYNWDPGAYFGLYRPDTFWMKPEARSASAQ
ncbi:MAG: ABC transporter substrate-binding protein [Methyloligellaceae bacterium]